MVALTFPDGARRDYPNGITGLDVAKAISPPNAPSPPGARPVMEKKRRETTARDQPFTKEVWPREHAKRVFRDMGEMFKVELVDAIPQGEAITVYRQGERFDLCGRPPRTST